MIYAILSIWIFDPARVFFIVLTASEMDWLSVCYHLSTLVAYRTERFPGHRARSLYWRLLVSFCLYVTKKKQWIISYVHSYFDASLALYLIREVTLFPNGYKENIELIFVYRIQTRTHFPSQKCCKKSWTSLRSAWSHMIEPKKQCWKKGTFGK